MLLVVVIRYATPQLGVPVITKIEREISPRLLSNANANALESPYAKNITFSNATVRHHPEDEGELLVTLKVTNNGPKTVTRLDVWIDFYNRNGRKAADEGELLVGGSMFGDDLPPISPGSSRRAVIELDHPEDWRGGKIIVRIDELQTK